MRAELQIFETLPLPIAVVRGDEIVLANRCLGAYFGIPVDTLSGTSVAALLQRVVVAADAGSLATGAETAAWVRVRDATGEPRRVCLRVSPMPGQVEEQIFVMLDASGEVPGGQPPAALAVLAHEVRNPLGAILNAVALLKRATGTIPAADLLSMIEEEAKRIDALVSDLLDLAQPLEPNLRQADRPGESRPADLVRPSSGSARSR